MTPVYLDYNATAPIRPEAAEAVARALAIGGNPSSVHARGRAARAAVETARAQVAALAGVEPADLVFTSGGTEANALAIESAVAGGAVKRLILGATEHDSVIETIRAQRLPAEIWPVDGQGVADLAWLEARLAGWDEADGRPFVALMAANNETGAIQPAAEAARLVHAAGGLIHLDAIQAAGKAPVGLTALGADTLSLSAHKLGGPQGVGALAFAPRAAIHRRLHGGGQERGLRAGTENVAGIAGFGAAAEAALKALPHAAAQAGWRDAAAEAVKAAGAAVAGEGAPRLPNTLCLAVADWPSALQVMALDLEGVMVSAGSACSSGKVKASHVLAAMGLGPLAEGSLRASGGWATTEDDWRRFAEAWTAAYARYGARHARAREFA
jgi:cysteine desulfurase